MINLPFNISFVDIENLLEKDITVCFCERGIIKNRFELEKIKKSLENLKKVRIKIVREAPNDLVGKGLVVFLEEYDNVLFYMTPLDNFLSVFKKFLVFSSNRSLLEREYNDILIRKAKEIQIEVDIIFFVSKNCPFSKNLVENLIGFPIINKKIRFHIVDIYENPEFSVVHNIRVVPTIIFKSGEKCIEKYEILTKEEFIYTIDSLYI